MEQAVRAALYEGRGADALELLWRTTDSAPVTRCKLLFWVTSLAGIVAGRPSPDVLNGAAEALRMLEENTRDSDPVLCANCIQGRAEALFAAGAPESIQKAVQHCARSVQLLEEAGLGETEVRWPKLTHMRMMSECVWIDGERFEAVQLALQAVQMGESYVRGPVDAEKLAPLRVQAARLLHRIHDPAGAFKQIALRIIEFPDTIVSPAGFARACEDFVTVCMSIGDDSAAREAMQATGIVAPLAQNCTPDHHGELVLPTDVKQLRERTLERVRAEVSTWAYRRATGGRPTSPRPGGSASASIGPVQEGAAPLREMVSMKQTSAASGETLEQRSAPPALQAQALAVPEVHEHPSQKQGKRGSAEGPHRTPQAQALAVPHVQEHQLQGFRDASSGPPAAALVQLVDNAPTGGRGIPRLVSSRVIDEVGSEIPSVGLTSSTRSTLEATLSGFTAPSTALQGGSGEVPRPATPEDLERGAAIPHPGGRTFWLMQYVCRQCGDEMWRRMTEIQVHGAGQGFDGVYSYDGSAGGLPQWATPDGRFVRDSGGYWLLSQDGDRAPCWRSCKHNFISPSATQWHPVGLRVYDRGPDSTKCADCGAPLCCNGRLGYLSMQQNAPATIVQRSPSVESGRPTAALPAMRRVYSAPVLPRCSP